MNLSHSLIIIAQHVAGLIKLKKVPFKRSKKIKSASKKEIQLITIISPLGIDLKKTLSLNFDNQEEINLPWSSCEQIGCLVFLSKGSGNEEMDTTYDKVYKNFISGKLLEIGVLGYATKQPLVIQSNLIGFKEATDKLNSEN